MTTEQATKLTLEDALKIRPAYYLECAQAGLNGANAVSAKLDQLVITNSTAEYPAACTKHPLETSLGIAVENVANKGTYAVAHLTPSVNKAEALTKMIGSVRRGEKDNVRIHIIGGLYEEGEAEAWKHEMQSLIDVINATPNVKLSTFDVGHKPHPATFAIANVEDSTTLIRGTPNISSYAEYEKMFDSTPCPHNQSLSAAHEFHVRTDGEPAPHIAYDGRLPRNQAETIRTEKLAAEKEQQSSSAQGIR